MKKLLQILTILSLITITTQSYASSTSVNFSLSPVYTVVDLVRAALLSTIAPFTTSTDLTKENSEEDLRIIEDDAMNYLATEDATDNLIVTVENIQQLVPELQDKDFDIVVVKILEAIK